MCRDRGIQCLQFGEAGNSEAALLYSYTYLHRCLILKKVSTSKNIHDQLATLESNPASHFSTTAPKVKEKQKFM